MRDRFQTALSAEEQFNIVQISDMFNKISQHQMQVITEVLTRSGLTISAKTSREKWIELVRQHPTEPTN